MVKVCPRVGPFARASRCKILPRSGKILQRELGPTMQPHFHIVFTMFMYNFCYECGRSTKFWYNMQLLTRNQMPLSKNLYLKSERSYRDFPVVTWWFWQIFTIFFTKLKYRFYLTSLRKNIWQIISSSCSFRTVKVLGYACARSVRYNSKLFTNPKNPRWRILDTINLICAFLCSVLSMNANVCLWRSLEMCLSTILLFFCDVNIILYVPLLCWQLILCSFIFLSFTFDVSSIIALSLHLLLFPQLFPPSLSPSLCSLTT